VPAVLQIFAVGNVTSGEVFVSRASDWRHAIGPKSNYQKEPPCISCARRDARRAAASLGWPAAIQAAGAYRVLDSPVTPVDVLAGVRYTYVHGDISYSGGRYCRMAPVEITARVGPTVSLACASYAFSEKWSIFGYADAGTGGTKHSWQLIAGADDNFTKSIAAKIGYRIISMDYEKPNFLYKIKTEGFFTGVSIKF
jgi:opacity protein-like surface antigen